MNDIRPADVVPLVFYDAVKTPGLIAQHRANF